MNLLRRKDSLACYFWYLLILGNAIVISMVLYLTNLLGDPSKGVLHQDLLMEVLYLFSVAYALFSSVVTWKKANNYADMELWQDWAKVFIICFLLGYILLVYLFFDANMSFLSESIQKIADSIHTRRP